MGERPKFVESGLLRSRYRILLTPEQSATAVCQNHELWPLTHLAFISGQLFTSNIRVNVYERLDQPVLVLYDQDHYTSFERLQGVLERRPNWHEARIVPSKGLPHFEELAQTTAALDRFWAGAKG